MLQFIRRLFLSLKCRCVTVKIRIRWAYDLWKTKKVNVDIVQTLPETKFLLLIPHADDEWMTNSMLVRYAKDVLLVNMDMQGSDTKDMHERRRAELMSLASKCNRKVALIVKDKAETLKKIILNNIGSTIVVPFFVDWHTDHIEVINILRDSLTGIPRHDYYKIMMYPVSCPLPVKYATHVIPMSKKQWVEKWNWFITYYRSQTIIPYKRFSYVDRIVGKSVGTFASELYWSCSIPEWLHLSDLLFMDDIQRTKLRKSINSINECSIMVKEILNIYKVNYNEQKPNE